MTTPETAYLTKDGDMVDLICWKHYGYSGGVTEMVMEANRHLAFLPAKLPSGITITLPAATAPAAVQPVRLWE